MPRTSIIVLLLFSGIETQAATSQALSIVGCGSSAGEHSVEFESSVILNQKLLELAHGKKAAYDAELREAIDHQLKYAYRITEHLKSIPSMASAEVEVLSITPRTYPLALSVDAYKAPHTRFEGGYIGAAVKRQFTFVDDPALEAKYRVKMRVAVCKVKPKDAPPEKIQIPIDPYLAFWFVPEEKRRPLRWGSNFNRVNPCASPEIVDGLSAPLNYWYPWRPHQVGTDTEGHPFDCTKILIAGKHYHEVKPTYAPASSLEQEISIGQELTRKSELDITAIFGVWDGRGRSLDPKLLATYFRNRNFFRENIVEVFKNAADKRKLFAEAGAGHFLTFLRTIPDVAEVTQTLVEVDGPSILFRLEGKLSLSRRKFKMKVRYGPSVYGAAAHWKTFHDGLMNSDIVLYNGHSGLGSSLDLNELARNIKIPREKLVTSLRARPYQMIAVLGCYSYRYFEAGLLKLRQGKSTDILTTGTQRYSHRIYPILLESIDRALAGQKPDFEKRINHHVPSGAFLLVKRVSS